MNIALWVLQILMSLWFIGVGIIHFVVPESLPAAMSWMYELPTGLHYFSGTAEILGGLGLILPGLTKIQTRLTPLAGAGLVLVMIGAAVWHISRGEISNIIQNLVFAAIFAFIAYGRWRLVPLADKSKATIA